MFEQRSLTKLESFLLLQKRKAGDEKTQLSWVEFPESGLRVNPKGRFMGITIGARGVFATGVPLTDLESRGFGFHSKNNEPSRVSLLFLSLPELMMAVKDYEEHEMRRTVNKLIYPYSAEQATKIMRTGYRLIIKRMFGREWDNNRGEFKGGSEVTERVFRAVTAQPDKEPLIICSHGAGVPKKYATPDGRAMELASHVWNNLPLDDFSAVLDSSCNYEGDIPNFSSAKTPYFGIYGPTSLVQKRQSLVIEDGFVQRYDAPIDADRFLFSSLALTKMIGFSIIDMNLKLESGINKVVEWRQNTGI